MQFHPIGKKRKRPFLLSNQNEAAGTVANDRMRLHLLSNQNEAA